MEYFLKNLTNQNKSFALLQYLKIKKKIKYKVTKIIN